MKNPYDPNSDLADLKDFQHNTVDYVFKRMYTDDDPAMRFLIADEVGLGKTLVAHGLVARTVQHLQQTQGKRRINVVYVCSNSDIAAQNIGRLALKGSSTYMKATRLTLLPLELKRSAGSHINFVAFTPNTSFNLRSSMGTATERALLHVLLTEVWGRRPLTTSGGYRILQGWVGKLGDFQWYIGHVRRRNIDPSLTNSFIRALERHDARAARARKPGFRERFDELSVRFRYPRPKNKRADADLKDRNDLVGELRQLLARVCLDSLKPDLVILDEFQRFRNLLEPTNEAGELARDLFEYGKVRVLLMSATPYKMYSLSDDAEDNHYRDFLRTARFLMNGQAEDFSEHLEQFRRALFDRDDDSHRRAIEAKRAVEDELRKVMVRTERLAVSADRSGMLYEASDPAVRLEPQDLRAFLATAHISRELGAGNAVEYWKSAPYLLNFMDGYKLIDKFRNATKDRRTRTWRTISAVLLKEEGTVPWDQYQAYQRIDPQNARLRGLLESTTGVGAWQLLWMPPAMPYYSPGPPFDDPQLAGFTKRLVFSAWNVVPKVVAALASYEAERQMMNSNGTHTENTREARTRIKPLLQFKTSRGQLGGMSTFALIYPSPSLARLGDPLTVAAEMTHGRSPVPVAGLLKRVERRIAEQLRPLTTGTPEEGTIDQRWYWAAPLLLDHSAGLLEDWFGQDQLANVWISTNSEETDDSETDQPEGTAFAGFLDHAGALVGGETTDGSGREVRPLGRVPDDLAEVLAELAVAAPGTVALRSLTRGPESDTLIENTVIRNAAASIGWAFRNLFNLSDVTTMIRNSLPYWRQVTTYCLNGGLQAVMDEYTHLLPDWLGCADGKQIEADEKIAAACREAIGLRTVSYVARDVVPGADRGGEYRFRSRFALRFGSERSEEKKQLERASSVRAAFNSPFWPFILATTSIGQEGLDFHLYCHAVVHWNLPANPVDLEQREGRVHRYKGHAIRKNLAQKHRATALSGSGDDPWSLAFDEAAKQRAQGDNDLIPYWLYPVKNGATIDRYVPSLPMSREIARLEDLKRALTLYRLVFGQPRQEDLVAYLLGLGKDKDEIEKLVDELRIDLTPPRTQA